MSAAPSVVEEVVWICGHRSFSLFVVDRYSLSVGSRMIPHQFCEELRVGVAPGLECLNRRSMVERLLRQVLVVGPVGTKLQYEDI